MTGPELVGSAWRTSCGACRAGAESLVKVLELANTPLPDVFAATAAEAVSAEWFPTGLMVCTVCGLVQSLSIVPDEALYGADYGYFTGSSPAARRYFADYATDLLVELVNRTRLEPFHAGEGPFVVEIACNDGTMLRRFSAAGLPVLGIEPSTGPAAAAAAAGLKVMVQPFTSEVGREIAEGRPADLVIANNVLAHVLDPDDFVAGLANLVADGGLVSIEVQHWAALLLGNQFDHVYHEHRSFFSLRALRSLLRRHGLFVHQVREVTGQGGSLRVLAVKDRGADRVTMTHHPDLVRATLDEQWSLAGQQIGGLQGRVDAIRARTLQLINAELAQGRTVVGYAASAKSCTMLNHLGVRQHQVSFILDTTPEKIGRFAPGTGIPIMDGLDPDLMVDPAVTTYLLLAGNYLPAVLRREREFFAAGGRMIVPLPAPVLL